MCHHTVRLVTAVMGVAVTFCSSKHLGEDENVKATIDGIVIADAPDADLISIDGTYYFPPSSVKTELFIDSSTPRDCPSNSDAQYHNVSTGSLTRHDVAWTYPHPEAASGDRPGRDYDGYVAFDKTRVTIK